MKKILIAILSLVLTVSMVACTGAGSSSTTESAASSDVTTSTSGETSETSTPPAETGEKVTVTVFAPSTSAMPMNNDLTVIKALSERTNTNFDFVNSPTTETLEKYNLMMASGDVPDMVWYVQDPILKYSSAYAPLNDLIAEYNPNYAALMDASPNLRRDTTAVDGNIYTMNSIAASKFANGFVVRQDWLDKLGLETPTTLDDFYNVLKAFKENDPNGNGEADEIPLISYSKRRGDAESPGLSIFAASWGIDEDFYVSPDGSEILFGATDPRMKEVLTYQNKLYSEGLIDQEYLTRDYAGNDTLVASEQAGMMITWGITVDTNLIAANPDSKLNILLPPAGADGVSKTFSQMPQTRSNAIAISKDAQNKEHIMSIFNEVYDPTDGFMLMNFGVEGETYTMVDGKPEFIPEILDNETGPLSAVRAHGINTWIPHQQVGDVFASETFFAGRDAYQKIILAPVPPLKFTDEEMATIQQVYTAEIQTYLNESLDSFITGKMPLDQFDTFVATLEGLGLPQILEIYNTAYQRYNQIG